MKRQDFLPTTGIVATLILLLAVTGGAQPARVVVPKRVLVVTTTAGFRHSSIPTAEKVLVELGKSSGVFTVEIAGVDTGAKEFKRPDGKADGQKVRAAIKTVLDEKMSPEALKKYDGIIFCSTTGDLPMPDPQAFLDWIKAGHAFIGMHAATDTFPGFAPYTEMIGGHFRTHGPQVPVDVLNQDASCPSCKHLPKSWAVFDEIYQLKDFDGSKVHRLLSLTLLPIEDREIVIIGTILHPVAAKAKGVCLPWLHRLAGVTVHSASGSKTQRSATPPSTSRDRKSTRLNSSHRT